MLGHKKSGGRRKGEEDLEGRAREGLAWAIEKSPVVAVQGLDREGAIRRWNDASKDLYGYSGSEVMGKPLRDLVVCEDSAGEFDDSLARAWDTGEPQRPGERKVRTKDGDERRVYSSFLPVLKNGEVVEVLSMDVDVTDRADSLRKTDRLTRLYSVLSGASRATIRLREPGELYRQVCRVAVEEGRYQMAWIGLVNGDNQLVEPAASWGRDDGFLDRARISILEIPEGLGPTGTAVRESRYVVDEDLELNAGIVPWIEEALKRGYRSCASFPLRKGAGIIGALTLYADEPGFFDEEQVGLLDALAENLSFAIESMEKEEERKRAQDALRRSEEYFRTLIDNISDIIAIIKSDGRIVYASPSVQRVMGYRRSELRDRAVFEFVHPDDVEEAGRTLQDALSDPGVTKFVELRMRHRDGSWRNIECAGRQFIDVDGSTEVIINARDVTGRWKAEEDLRRSESTAQALLNAPEESAFLLDAEGGILAANLKGAQALGMGVEELVGKRLANLLPPEIGEERNRMAEEVLMTGEAVRFEDQLAERHFDNSVYPIHDTEGRVNRLAVFARDITERKHAAEAQKKDRDFISAVLETTGALVVVQEREGRIVLFNRTAEQVTGYTLDDVRGRRTWEIFSSPNDAGAAKEAFERLRQGELPREEESYWLNREGEQRLISWSNTVLLGEGGEPEYVIGTGIDVSERRKAEEALRESEERYRSIFESTGTAMCIVESDNIVSFLNQEFERISGYRSSEIEKKRSFVELIHPEDADVFNDCHAEVMDFEENVPLHFECRIRDKQGNVKNAFANISRLPGTDSSVMSLIDITREKEYEHDLAETAERLRHFLTVASHELRHPITILKGYANILTARMDSMSEEMIVDVLKDIDISADRLTRYVAELMDVARVEEGRFPVQRRRADPKQLLEMARKDMKIMGVENEITIEVEEGTGEIRVDWDKFVQLLDILTENAVMFSSPGSPVKIEAGKTDEGLMVSVLDRGIGVPEEDREKIFDRFYQVVDALHHSKPGIGLGLFIAREIVVAHDGRIWCEPRDGGGAVFRFIVS